MAVHLKYFQGCPNVGDQFAVSLAKHYFSPDIIPVPCDYGQPSAPNLLLVGSILGNADKLSYVCGAGFIGARDRLRVAPRYIKGVRGPLTAAILERQSLRSAYTFGDPGILASKIFPRTESAQNEVGIIPHYVDMNSPWVKSCRDQGLTVIDVLSPLDEFFANLQRCAIILSSSLHGLVFAHSYDIPAVWIELSDQVIGSGFKFFDYYLSMGISPEDVTRFPILDNPDPRKIAKLASVTENKKLLENLETALNETKVELEKAIDERKLK
ncbi:MAG TPA: hypothetical protein ENI11_02480 [Actinobacteria bacterium]|nr:hypothetical protein [Actinomycetota bacterium]